MTKNRPTADRAPIHIDIHQHHHYHYRIMTCHLFLLGLIVTGSHAYTTTGSVGPWLAAHVPRASSFAARRTARGTTSSATATATRTRTRRTALFGKKGWKNPSSSSSNNNNNKLCSPTVHVVEMEYGIVDQDAWKMVDIVEILQRGGVGVLPTETGYGLVTRLEDNKAGTERFWRLVNQSDRKNKKPLRVLLSVLCSDLATMDAYCALYTLPKQVFKILKKNLPGPYTFLLQATAKSLIGLQVHDNDSKIGIRMPEDVVLRYFQDELYGGAPLLFCTLSLHSLEDNDDMDDEDDDMDHDETVSSSNQMYQLVEPQPSDWYWDQVDFVVTAGSRPRADASTVIDLTSRNGDPQLVRPGLLLVGGGALELTV